MEITICRRGRGEGKSSWLAKKIDEAILQSNSTCYVFTSDKGNIINQYLTDNLFIPYSVLRKRVVYMDLKEFMNENKCLPFQHPVYIFIDMVLTFYDIETIIKYFPEDSRFFITLNNERY